VIKTILVPATGNETDIAALDAALRVAQVFAAHIDALHIRIDSVEIAVATMTDGGGAAMTDGLVEQLEQDARDREAKALRIFTDFCGRERLSIAAAPGEAKAHPSAQWHVETGEEPHWTIRYGLAADLIVASRGPAADPTTARSFLEEVLIETGRPLLIPGDGASSTTMTERIAIAWKPTPQTARAVAAAMPLLVGAKEIVVMTVQEEEDRSDDADRLVRNLEWHGLKAVAHRLKPDADSAADTLLAAAAEKKCGLLVMGGYGHGQLREWIFGGFTQRVLVSAPVPVLIVH
jgi:nucleotide-binding universal stress UspA family protein